MESIGGGRLSRWTGGPRLGEGGESGAKSGADKSKGGRWGLGQDMEGEGGGSRKQFNDGTGIYKA